MRYNLIFLGLIMLFLLFSSTVFAQQEKLLVVHGDIVEVFPEENKVRVICNGDMKILQVHPLVEIYRNTQKIELQSLRPITEDRFQEGIFLIERDFVYKIFVNYQVVEEDGQLKYYDIFGEVKDIESL